MPGNVAPWTIATYISSITNVPMLAGRKLLRATPVAYEASTGMNVMPPG